MKGLKYELHTALLLAFETLEIRSEFKEGQIKIVKNKKGTGLATNMCFVASAETGISCGALAEETVEAYNETKGNEFWRIKEIISEKGFINFFPEESYFNQVVHQMLGVE